jgi:hypothetical protein
VKSAAKMVLSHLGQASDAKLPVDQVEKRQHDRTPLLDHWAQWWQKIISGRLRRARKMVSSTGRIVSSKGGEEIASRACERGLQAQTPTDAFITGPGAYPGRTPGAQMLASGP